MFSPKTRNVVVQYAEMELSVPEAQDLLCAINIAWNRGYHTDFTRTLMVHLTEWEARTKDYGPTIPTWGLDKDKP